MADILCPKSGVLIRKSIVGRSGVESKYLSEFEEIEIIGSGGFGVVARSLNKLDQQYYAVKKIPISNATFEKYRYRREVIVHAQMDHENIVRFITSWIEVSFEGGFATDEDFPDEEDLKAPCLYMQLECCTGTLKKSLETELATPNIWFHQILDAVAYMHKKNIIHRDLCVDNLLVKGDCIKLSDFGLAKEADSDGKLGITGSGGHALYRAPEVVKGEEGVDARADIFSLGVLLFEMYSDSSQAWKGLEL